MSLSALQVAANSAQPPPDHSRDASAKSGAGAAFAAMISAVAAEAPAASAHGASPKQSGGAEKNGRSSDDSSQTANSQSSQPVETDIAGLVFGALAGQYAQQGATAAAPAQSATPAAASEAPPAAPLWRAVTGRAAVASKDRFSTTTASPASATVAATETSALTAAAAGADCCEESRWDRFCDIAPFCAEATVGTVDVVTGPSDAEVAACS